MGGAVIYFQIVFFGLPILLFLCILTAACKGYPRAGRRAYVIAIAPQIIVAAAIVIYFRFGTTWFGPDTLDNLNKIIPISFLVLGLFLLVAGVAACLLALLLYRRTPDSLARINDLNRKAGTLR